MAERGDPSDTGDLPTLRDASAPSEIGEPTIGAYAAPWRRGSESGEFQSAHALAPGARVGHFVLERKLGEGGMGLVFLARDLELERPVAVKVLRLDRDGADDANARHRLLREARAMAMLSHPNLVTIYEVGTLADNLFLAMEYVTGQSLDEWLEIPRPVEDILSVFDQAGRGLGAMHEAGLVHRDFKPANVVVTQEGLVKVLDLGIARRVAGASELRTAKHHPTPGLGEATPAAELRTTPYPSEQLFAESTLDEPLTRDGAIMGTPSYMPLEQILGEATSAASDQFAFAVALFEALTGAKPYPAQGRVELLKQALSEERHTWPPDHPIPPDLRAAIDRALSLYPEQRFESLAAFLDACWGALGQSARGVVSTRRQTRPSDPWLPLVPSERPEPVFEPARESHASGPAKAEPARLGWVLVLVLVLVTAALGVTRYELAKQSQELQAAQRAELESSIATLRGDVERFFAAAEQDVLIAYDQRSAWLPLLERLALPRPAEPTQEEPELSRAAAGLNDLFYPLVERTRSVRWLGVARDDGLAFFVLARGGPGTTGQLVNQIVTPRVAGRALELEWSPALAVPSRARWSSTTDFDRSFAGHTPSFAEWFRTAGSDAPRVAWTDPYAALGTTEPGALAGIVWPHPPHRYAIGMALALSELATISSQARAARVRTFVTARGPRAPVKSLDGPATPNPLAASGEPGQGALAAALAVEPRGRRTLWPFRKGDHTLWAGRAFIDRHYPALTVYAIQTHAQ